MSTACRARFAVITSAVDHSEATAVGRAERRVRPPTRGRGPDEHGVSDGTRTRDHRHHKPELYQLSYAHHALCRPTRKWSWRADRGSLTDARGWSVRIPGAPIEVVQDHTGYRPATSVATACTWSVFGPGAGTNAVPR